VTAFAAVAAWAGLYAWQQATPRFAGSAPEPELPARVAPTIAAFPAASARVVDAAAELRSGARPARGVVDVLLTGTAAPDGPDRIAILDGRTGAEWAAAPLPADLPGSLRFAGVPEGEHQLVLFRGGDSPRRSYALRRAFTLAATATPAELALTLAVDTRPGVLLLHRDEAAEPATWLPVTARLERPDDPGFCALPRGPRQQVFEPGAAELVFEFPPLGPGRYELVLSGFDAAEPAIFELPVDGLIVRTGRAAR
jgi:hypothetical protein